jgi:hypothetical protein
MRQKHVKKRNQSSSRKTLFQLGENRVTLNLKSLERLWRLCHHRGQEFSEHKDQISKQKILARAAEEHGIQDPKTLEVNKIPDL